MPGGRKHWDMHPELYEKDSDGNFILKKNGEPKKIRGRRKGTKPKAYNYHSETKAKMEARRKIREKKKEIERARVKIARAKKAMEPTKELLEKLDDSHVKKTGRVVEDETIESVAPSLRADAETSVIFKANEGPQEDFLAADETDVLYGGSAGGGKVVLEHQHVLGPQGFISIKDLKVGDVICDPAGGYQTITHLHPWQENEKWVLEFDDGTRYDTVSGHLWYYKLASDSRWHIKSTEEMIEHSEARNRKAMIPMPDAVDFEGSEVPVEPYTLGVLLGEGHITTDRIAVSSGVDDQHHYMSRMDIDLTDWSCNGQHMGIIGPSRVKTVKALEDLKLLGTYSHNKFIPDNYKLNSKEVRIEILRGLMDTDGYRDPSRARVEYCTISKDLADDVRFIAMSLGFRVSTYEKTPYYTGACGSKLEGQKAYRVYITGQNVDSLFSLKRKQSGTAGKQLNRRVIACHKTKEKVNGRCITVSAPHSLYISDDFVVTHNSYAMIVDPLRFAHRAAHRALILRRSMPELRELIDKSRELYPRAFPGCKYREVEKLWNFPSGAKIEFGFLERDADVYRYQGQAYSWIGFDEITHLATEFSWNYLASRLRTTDPEITPYMRCVPYGEVLTETGWKDIKEIEAGTLVQSMNSKGEMELKPVTKHHVYEIDEKIVKYKTQTLDAVFTQDHRIVYKRKSEFYTKEWRDAPTRFNIQRACAWEGEGLKDNPLGIDINHYLMLLGIYLAKGSVNHTPRKGNYKVIITQKKGHTQKEICNLLDKIGQNYCVLSNGDIQITKKDWWIHFKEFGYAHEKFIPRYILENATYNELYILFQWMMKGDDNWQTSSSGGYYTNSEQLGNDVQEVCVKLGFRASKTLKCDDETQWRDKHTIHFAVTDTSEVRKNEAKLVDFSGKVYCISVQDNENFVLRQNGKSWVSGNCTANPGGVGASWVKKRYISPAEPGTAFRGEDGITRRFIPARLQDNPYLTQDGHYEQMLKSLPPTQRRQLLEGDWDVAEGAAFTEFERPIHVIDPFEIPMHWERIKGIDYGYASESACVWGAIDPSDGTLIIYRELYQKGLTGEALGEMITSMELNDPWSVPGVLDTACWSRTGHTGPTIAEVIIRQGHKLRPADKNRLAGKVQIHEYLKVQKSGRPRLQIMSHCPNLIRELQSIPLDKTRPEDVDTKAPDHAYDALRYLIMSRPRVIDTMSRIRNFQREQHFEPADSTFGY